MEKKILVHRLVPTSSSESDRRRFRDELVKLGSQLDGHLILDISDVKTLDSLMLGTLALFNKTLPAGTRVIVVGANPTVRTVLMVTRFDSVIPVAETVEQAMALLGKPSRAAGQP